MIHSLMNYGRFKLFFFLSTMILLYGHHAFGQQPDAGVMDPNQQNLDAGMDRTDGQPNLDGAIEHDGTTEARGRRGVV